MSKLNARIVSGLVAAGLLASGSAFAQERMPWRGDFWGYIGASGGESKFRSDCARTDVFACDQRDTAWKLYAGGKMSEILGLEAGYTDFGKVAASGGQTKAWAANLSLLAGVPIGNRFNVFGKVGGLYGRTDVTADPDTLFDRGHKSGWGWTYGVGAGFNVTQNVALRVDWDRYKLDFVGGRRDLDMASAGVQFRF
ncbi:MAG: outer membrane beta-barrel protein [Betaproteobacteria bacterium]